jgi:hypothetical protein
MLRHLSELEYQVPPEAQGLHLFCNPKGRLVKVKYRSDVCNTSLEKIGSQDTILLYFCD